MPKSECIRAVTETLGIDGPELRIFALVGMERSNSLPIDLEVGKWGNKTCSFFKVSVEMSADQLESVGRQLIEAAQQFRNAQAKYEFDYDIERRAAENSGPRLIEQQ